jgi:N6-L-threonylcarbamoyladenine synthase
VDHIEAHATSAALVVDPAPWPAIALVVSGGHTSIYLVRDFLDIELLGQTTDDAAGEAFDKVAAILELGYPGGPVIDRVARSGDPRAIRFPRTWLDKTHLDFSFSGLKTAVLYHVYGKGRKYGSARHLSESALADVAASFQAALIEPLIKKTVAAAQRTGVRNVVLGGGVAANSALRAGLKAACDQAGLALHMTPIEYCADNAAMVAGLGYHRLCAGRTADLSLEPRGGLLRPRAKRRAKKG